MSSHRTASPADSGVTSPKSNGTAPIKKFDRSSIQPHLGRILATRLASLTYERDRERLEGLAAEIGDEVKKLMLEQQPIGYKYVSVVQIVENKGQAGRAALTAHWDEQGDAVVREVWSNDTLLATVIAFAIRVAY